jgi:hypothetical protein
VEVKTPDGRLSAEQKQFLAEIGGMGGLTVMVRDWRDLDTALRSAGYAADLSAFPEIPPNI